jgi:CheY-like chemotaxis protein
VRPIRVLVVDDTPHVRQMLVAMLSLDGFDVVADVDDGPEALAFCAGNASNDGRAPDVVVVDYQMPGMDGLTTARQLREAHPDLRIILHTAFADDAVERAAAEAGVAVCLAKVEGLGALEQEISRLGGGL